MESFESDTQNCVLDSLENGELIKLDDQWYNMIGGLGVDAILAAEFYTIWGRLRWVVFFCRDQREWNYYNPCKR